MKKNIMIQLKIMMLSGKKEGKRITWIKPYKKN